MRKHAGKWRISAPMKKHPVNQKRPYFGLFHVPFAENMPLLSQMVKAIGENMFRRWRTA